MTLSVSPSGLGVIGLPRGLLRDVQRSRLLVKWDAQAGRVGADAGARPSNATPGAKTLKTKGLPLIDCVMS